MKLTINVSPEGATTDAYNCPVARGFQPHFPGKEVLVGFVVVRVDGKVVCELPKEVTQKIFDMYGGKPMEPFSFEQEIPDA